MYETDAEIDAFYDAFYDIKKGKRLGAGGFGLAIEALDETEQVKKVFKLPKDECTTEALKIEGKNLGKLECLLSPNIIRLYKYGRVKIDWDGRKEVRYYLCLAFGGTSLREKLGELIVKMDADGNAIYEGSGNYLSIDEGLRISIEVCQGLKVAHGFKDSEVRIIHRDIKPANILIDDNTCVARIADFGISRVVDRSVGICSVAGTLLYMDPECFQGHAGPYSDLYSLGIVMYEMLTGQLPFENFQARLIHSPKDPCLWNPKIPKALAQIILRAIDNDLNKRYENADQLLSDLRGISASLNPLPPNYEKVEDLGSRMMVCRNKETHQSVMIHLVESDASLAELTREKKALEDLNIPSIVVPVQHYSKEHLTGTISIFNNDKTIIETLGRTPVSGTNELALLCELTAKICDVVAAANERGVVHGYLSPRHMYCDHGHGMVLYGYGSTSLLSLRKSGTKGTEAFIEAFRDFLPYMSPNVLKGEKPVPSDDVFSLGSSMYTLLTGQPYAYIETLQRLVGGETVEPPVLDPRAINTLVTKRIANMVIQAMEWEESIRKVSAADMAAILRQCKWPDDIVESLTDDAVHKYQSGDVDGAYSVVNKALIADPGNPLVHYTKGQIYYWQKEYSWAVSELQKSADVMPSYDVHLLQGRCFMEWGKNKQAAKRFAEALKCGDSPELRYLLAVSLHRQGLDSEARIHMRSSIALEADRSLREQHECELKEWG